MQEGVFAFAWSVLYPIVFMVYGCMTLCMSSGHVPTTLAVPIAINVTANLAFHPLLKRTHSHVLALLDLLVVLASTVWIMVLAWPMTPWVSLFLVPYLLWVGYATALQAAIAVRNEGQATAAL